MAFKDRTMPYVYRGVHNYGTHFATSRAKWIVIDELAKYYPRPVLQEQTFQMLLDLCQLECEIRAERKESTPRQQEVQRLWQQRGLLERTKANLRSVAEITMKAYGHRGAIASALVTISLLIDINKQQAATIKERIPS